MMYYQIIVKNLVAFILLFTGTNIVLDFIFYQTVFVREILEFLLTTIISTSIILHPKLRKHCFVIITVLMVAGRILLSIY